MNPASMSKAAFLQHRIVFFTVLVLALPLGGMELYRGAWYEATVMLLAIVLATLELRDSFKVSGILSQAQHAKIVSTH